MVPRASSTPRTDILNALHITPRSLIGAITSESGGLVLYNGWLRILGGGGRTNLTRDIGSWNKHRLKNAYLIGDDIMGGFFAVNSGFFGARLGAIYYWSPDTHEWESLEIMYSDFVYTMLQEEQFITFYESMLWSGWRQVVDKLAITGDDCIALSPALVIPGMPIAARDMVKITAGEAWKFVQ